MTIDRTLAISLRERPTGELEPTFFDLVEQQVPELSPGEILIRTGDLSLDPYLRATLVGKHIGDRAVPIGGVIPGRSVGQVIRSRDERFAEGVLVLAETGWRELAVVPGSAATPVSVPEGVASSAVLSTLGMPGLTAYASVVRHLTPRVGDTVAISSATGGVGAVAGQLAKLSGARTVAIVGHPRKARIATEELGYDASVVRTADDWTTALVEACPQGIDAYLHMGDAATLDVAMEQLATGARVSLVGIRDAYGSGSATKVRAGAVMSARATVSGMVVFDHADIADEQVARLGSLLREGKMVLHEDRYQGLAKAPEAFIGLLAGENHGKVIVEVSPRDD